MAACEGTPTGPSLAAVQVSDVRLQATEGNASLCCCRVAAVAENQNAVPVHVTVKFVGLRREPGTFRWRRSCTSSRTCSRARDEPILASGFLLACNRLKDVRVEVDVTGTASVLP